MNSKQMKLMKIDRSRLLSAMEYIRQINDTNFDELDFSEFFDVNDPEYKEMSEQFKQLGMSNKDFIMMYRNKLI